MNPDELPEIDRWYISIYTGEVFKIESLKEEGQTSIIIGVSYPYNKLPHTDVLYKLPWVHPIAYEYEKSLQIKEEVDTLIK